MKRIISILIFLVLSATSVFAIEGKVIGISDGDTITLLTKENKQIKVRLYGIDSPEKKQDFGQKAKQFSSDLVFGKSVNLEQVDTDRYGRTVGIIKAGDMVLNEELIKNGFAWYYGQYCKKDFCSKWQQFESQAKIQKIGLWSTKDPIEPWNFRKNKKSTDNVDNNNTYQSNKLGFSGNKKSMIFHKSSCKNYECKNCIDHFETRDAAINAGYKPCGFCSP